MFLFLDITYLNLKYIIEELRKGNLQDSSKSLQKCRKNYEVEYYKKYQDRRI